MPGNSLNVGLVGYQFMGKAHSNAWLQAPHFFNLPLQPFMHTLCGRSLEPLKRTAATWGWKNFTTNYKDLLHNPEIDLIDVAVPNNAHPEIVIAAAEAKKAIACEKPLARTWAEAKAMHAAVKKARVNNFVWFNYRRVPAVAFARQLVQQGRIGKIFHVRGLYLQDWIKNADFPLVWRLSKEIAGSGSHGDLCAHSIDMLRYISGDEIIEVCGLFETFIKQRPVGRMTEGLSAATGGGPRKLGKVDVDDAVWFLCRLKGGGVGTFEATRFATGYHNANTLEINGDKGSLRFDFPNFSFLEFFDDTLPASEKGWRKISCTTANHPYAGKYWPADHPIGYAETFVNTAADIAAHLAESKKPGDFHANFDDGLACQRVLEAVTLSATEKRWVYTREID